jgi:hypothetical protein
MARRDNKVKNMIRKRSVVEDNELEEGGVEVDENYPSLFDTPVPEVELFG